MIAVLAILIGGAALLLVVPTLTFCLEVLAALGRARPQANPDTAQPQTVVVIPAHDEALGITATLLSVRPQLGPQDRMLVVADNCTDDTAAIAAAAGADVIERQDANLRGKGYALDYAIRHLRQAPPQVVLIVDADCQVAPGAIKRLSTLCLRTSRPIQALYLMHAPTGAGTRMRIAEFAWLVKNQVRAAGLHRLGLPCQLMGTGMAFPWPVIEAADLATGHIVEDMKLGIDLAVAGSPPLFCPEALVTSEFPTSSEGERGQRTRWEHGHLAMIQSQGLPLLRRSLLPLRVALLAMALDLCVPPLTLLCALVGAVWAAAALLHLLSSSTLPLAIATLPAAALLLSVMTAWVRYGTAVVPFSTLALAPLYALWKIPLYGKFLLSRQVEWVRSRRDEPPSGR